jgi:hypothetical protein
MNVRNATCLAVMGIGLGLAAPAQGQQNWDAGHAASFVTGVHPSDVTFKPVDLSKAIAPVPQQTTDKFSFRRYLSKVIPGISPTPGPATTPLAPTRPFVPNTTPLPVMKSIGLPVLPGTPKQ